MQQKKYFYSILISLIILVAVCTNVFKEEASEVVDAEPLIYEMTSIESDSSIPMDITINGYFDKAMLDQFTDVLKVEEQSPPKANPGPKQPQYIDMSQFQKTILDIPYTNTINEYQKLDIIYPSVGKAPYKFIMVFHGGGWIKGHRKSASIASIQSATQQGYAVINVSYRLATEAKWPAQLHDVKAAVRFIRANATNYHLDATNIVVWGSSAGGQLAQMLAATNDLKEMEDLSMGNPNTSSKVQGVVSWYGVSDVTSLINHGVNYANTLMGFDVSKNINKAKIASPLEYVNKNFPPVLLVHGSNDQVVPLEQSVQMAIKVNKLTGKNQAKLKIVINGKHSDPAIKSISNVDDNLYFVDKIMYPNSNNPYRSKKYVDIKVVN